MRHLCWRCATLHSPIGCGNAPAGHRLRALPSRFRWKFRREFLWTSLRPRTAVIVGPQFPAWPSTSVPCEPLVGFRPPIPSRSSTGVHRIPANFHILTARVYVLKDPNELPLWKEIKRHPPPLSPAPLRCLGNPLAACGAYGGHCGSETSRLGFGRDVEKHGGRKKASGKCLHQSDRCAQFRLQLSPHSSSC
jgi:hypothetical protein